jgi:hypothetical protein
MDFTTLSGPVIETLGEFNGSAHSSLPYETATVGTFLIPANALSAVISGTYGNSTVPNSAAVNLCLGSGGVCGSVATTPLPAALPLFATGLGVLGFVGRWRKKRALAA